MWWTAPRWASLHLCTFSVSGWTTPVRPPGALPGLSGPLGSAGVAGPARARARAPCFGRNRAVRRPEFRCGARRAEKISAMAVARGKRRADGTRGSAGGKDRPKYRDTAAPFTGFSEAGRSGRSEFTVGIRPGTEARPGGKRRPFFAVHAGDAGLGGRRRPGSPLWPGIFRGPPAAAGGCRHAFRPGGPRHRQPNPGNRVSNRYTKSQPGCGQRTHGCATIFPAAPGTGPAGTVIRQPIRACPNSPFPPGLCRTGAPGDRDRIP
jgi:hypothetical protein